MSLWGKKHQEAAQLEGWGVFWVVDNGKPIKSSKLTILPVDNRFKHRYDATGYVVINAKQRSELHVLALQVCAASMAAASR